jgi:hypothetical protein
MGVCLGKLGGGICSSRAHGLTHGAGCRRRLGAARGLRAAGGRRSRHTVLFYRWLVYGWNERSGPQAPRHKGQTGKIRAEQRDGVRRNAEGPAAARGVDQHAKSGPVQQRRAGRAGTGVDRRARPSHADGRLQRDREGPLSHSNIYSGAPMPYMQRITWSGVALHEGELPGHPASHGCIRMSHDFAKKLWPITKLGVRVIVARDELTPTEFAHAKLFVPRSKPAEPQTALSGAIEDASRPTAKFAEAAIEHTDRVPSDAAPDPIKAAPVSSESVKPSPTVDPPTPLVPRYKVTDQPITRTGQVAVFVSRKEKKVFVRQGFVPLFELPIAIEDPDQPLGTHVFTAMEVTEDGTGMRWNLMTVATDPSVSVEHRDSRRRSKEPPKPIIHGKPPSTAAQALDRIHLPQEVVDRIGELLVPGSSLVVSDEGLGRETGRGTEFIVLTR